MDKIVAFTNDELHAFSEHVTWCIYEQDQPVDDNLQSFIDKVLYDNQLDSLSEGKDFSPPYHRIPDRY
jgi:hypothetical protein|tara:strand:- start:548 stop:751 length:204 start_codon:yes stop_codon:yes gene_type:complete